MVAPENGVGAEESGARTGGRTLLWVAAAVGLGFLVYLNALGNPFVYDDHRLILENGSLAHLADLRGIVLHDQTRPLTNLSYALDVAVWGTRPFGFHLTNLLLHLLNVVLLFRVALRMAGPSGRPTVVAAVAATLFAVHPMLTESVGYVSSRTEILCAAFFLPAFLCGRRWLGGFGARWGVLTLVFWILAVLSKEVAVMLPFVLAAGALFFPSHPPYPPNSPHLPRLAYPTHPPFQPSRVWPMLLTATLVALAFAAVRVGVLTSVEHTGGTGLDWRLGLVELDVMRQYLWLFVAPRGQTIFHSVSPIESVLAPGALLALAVGAVVLGVAWRLRRPAPIVSFGLVWFVLLLLPSSALVMLDRGEPMAEHRTYLASCGLFLSVGGAAAWLSAIADVSRRARVLAALIVVVVVGSLSARTVLRNVVWSTPVGLWLEAAERSPDHWWPRLQLGQALLEAGRPAEAVVEFQSSIALRPQEPLTYAKLGESLTELRRFAEASAALEQLRQLAPDSPIAFTGLGAVAMQSGDTERARQYFRAALTRDPDSVPARLGLAELARAQDPDEARRLCKEIDRLAPEAPRRDPCSNEGPAAGR